jgi:integrase/recombinase XerD
MKATNFPALIQRFFTDRLCTQMEASRHTIAGYRETDGEAGEGRN